MIKSFVSWVALFAYPIAVLWSANSYVKFSDHPIEKAFLRLIVYIDTAFFLLIIALAVQTFWGRVKACRRKIASFHKHVDHTTQYNQLAKIVETPVSEEDRKRVWKDYETRRDRNLVKNCFTGDDLAADSFRCACNTLMQLQPMTYLQTKYPDQNILAIDKALIGARSLRQAVLQLASTAKNLGVEEATKALVELAPGHPETVYRVAASLLDILQRLPAYDHAPLLGSAAGTDITRDAFRLSRSSTRADYEARMAFLKFRYCNATNQELETAWNQVRALHAAINKEGQTVYNDPEYSAALRARIRAAAPGCSDDAYGAAIDYLYFIYR